MQQATQGRRRPKWLIPAAVALLVVIAGGAAWLLTRPDSFTASGRVVLSGDSLLFPDGSDCTPARSMPGLTGARVVVSDAAGTTLALAQLDAPRRDDSRRCVWSFRADVPPGQPAYGLQIEGVAGRIQVTEQELRAGTVELAPGS